MLAPPFPLHSSHSFSVFLHFGFSFLVSKFQCKSKSPLLCHKHLLSKAIQGYVSTESFKKLFVSIIMQVCIFCVMKIQRRKQFQEKCYFYYKFKIYTLHSIANSTLTIFGQQQVPRLQTLKNEKIGTNCYSVWTDRKKVKGCFQCSMMLVRIKVPYHHEMVLGHSLTLHT